MLVSAEWPRVGRHEGSWRQRCRRHAFSVPVYHHDRHHHRQLTSKDRVWPSIRHKRLVMDQNFEPCRHHLILRFVYLTYGSLPFRSNRSRNRIALNLSDSISSIQCSSSPNYSAFPSWFRISRGFLESQRSSFRCSVFCGFESRGEWFRWRQNDESTLKQKCRIYRWYFPFLVPSRPRLSSASLRESECMEAPGRIHPENS